MSARPTLYLETSPDARTWTERMKGAHDTRLEGVQLGFNVTTTTIEAFEAPLLDNINLAP